MTHDIKRNFLVFSDDFGEHPSSCQHIFHIISEEHSVLWVNTVGMRTPQLSYRDLKKALLKVKRMLTGTIHTITAQPHLQNTSIDICQPLMLPFLRFPFIRRLNKVSVVNSVRKRLNSLGMKNPIIVITAPNACDYLGYFNEQKVVYYCVDDFSEWPGLDKTLVESMQNSLIKKADIFIATSQELKTSLEAKGKKVSLMTHGVDYSHFSNKISREHATLTDIPRPRIGYFGLFDRRSNLELLINTAKKLPHVSFVITGNVEVETANLEIIDNIYFTGSIAYDELPEMTAGWEICILPYKVNKLTDAINPLKIKEYLATNKPIISTPIKEASKLKEYISIANTSEEWVTEIQRILTSDSEIDSAERYHLLENEGWTAKAKHFYNRCIEG